MKRSDTPERGLMAALVRQALLDVRLGADDAAQGFGIPNEFSIRRRTKGSPWSRYGHVADAFYARDWFFAPESNYVFSFGACCDCLELSRTRIRNGVLEHLTPRGAAWFNEGRKEDAA